MRKLWIMLAVAALCAPSPSRAASDGCLAAGTHSDIDVDSPWQCHYTATGPGFYIAATPNPFVIVVDRPSAPTQSFRIERSGPVTAMLATKGGDQVSVSISCWNFVSRAGCPPGDPIGGREGFLLVQSEIVRP